MSFIANDYQQIYNVAEAAGITAADIAAGYTTPTIYQKIVDWVNTVCGDKITATLVTATENSKYGVRIRTNIINNAYLGISYGYISSSIINCETYLAGNSYTSSNTGTFTAKVAVSNLMCRIVNTDFGGTIFEMYDNTKINTVTTALYVDDTVNFSNVHIATNSMVTNFAINSENYYSFWQYNAKTPNLSITQMYMSKAFLPNNELYENIYVANGGFPTTPFTLFEVDSKLFITMNLDATTYRCPCIRVA